MLLLSGAYACIHNLILSVYYSLVFSSLSCFLSRYSCFRPSSYFSCENLFNSSVKKLSCFTSLKCLPWGMKQHCHFLNWSLDAEPQHPFHIFIWDHFPFTVKQMSFQILTQFKHFLWVSTKIYVPCIFLAHLSSSSAPTLLSLVQSFSLFETLCAMFPFPHPLHNLTATIFCIMISSSVG